MITSVASKQMKYVSQLMKKARARNDAGLFVVEGIRMFVEIPTEWIEQIYVSEGFLDDQAHRKLLQPYQYEVVANHVFSSISDTKTPQGILALVKMQSYRLDDLLKKECPQLLVVEDIQDPGNLGTMFRTGEGAGIDGVVMTKETVDIYNPKTIRSTMGSIFRIPFYVTEDLEQTLAQLKAAQINLYAAHLKGTQYYDEPDYSKGTAFLIGNEGRGLSEKIADAADTYIRIPMEGNVESLNAAMAATILMYEVNRQRRKR